MPGEAGTVEISADHTEKNRQGRVVIMAAGLLAAVATGLLAGWVRYWLGFFVLVQGALSGLVISWVMAKTANRCFPGPGPMTYRVNFTLACLLFLFHIGAQIVGFGLAQPWFDPLGWLGRVISGHSTEFIFGVAATAGIHRGFALGIEGAFWFVFSAIDWAILFVFLFILPGARHGKKGKKLPVSVARNGNGIP